MESAPNRMIEAIRRLEARHWWLIGTTVALCLLGITYWDARRDIAPPDGSDIPVYKMATDIPDEENGFVLLHRIGVAIDAIETEQEVDIHELFDPGLYQEEEDDLEPKWSEISNLFQQLEPVLAPVDTALQTPHFADLWVSVPSAESSADIPTVMKTMFFLRYRTRLFAHQSKWNDAWEDQIRLLQISAKLCRGETYVIGTIVGTTGYGMGCEFVLRHLLPFTPSTAITLRRTDQLRQFQLDPKDLKKQLILENGNHHAEGYVELGKMFYDEPNLYLNLIFYKPNATLSLHLELMREAISNAEQLPINMSFPVNNEVHNNPPWLLNYRGYAILQLNNFDELIYRFHAANAYLTVTRVGLALAGYTQEHEGALPTTLEELVPRYLSDLPTDPMDGNPLRYDPAQRKVWSIGRNLVDDGGAPLDPFDGYNSEKGDIVVKIPPL